MNISDLAEDYLIDVSIEIEALSPQVTRHATTKESILFF